MKNKIKIYGLTILLLVLWLYNSYLLGDFEDNSVKESMKQMDARFPALPETEFNDKKEQLEIDLEEYEKTVNSMSDVIRDRIEIQKNMLEDNQNFLRPAYEEPRHTNNDNHEIMNPPPVPKKLHSIG